MHHKKHVRLHERGGEMSSGAAYAPERILGAGLHASSDSAQHHVKAGSSVKKGSTNSYICAHKTGGMVRSHHACGGSAREPHFLGALAGLAAPFLGKMLGLKKGGKVTAAHLEQIKKNPQAMKMLKQRHAELSSQRNLSGKNQREHHFLGSLIRGAMKFAKPLIGRGLRALAPHAAKAAAPYVQRGLNAIGNRMPDSVKRLGKAAMPLARTGIEMMEQRSPKFARGMNMARQGAGALGVQSPFKKGGSAKKKSSVRVKRAFGGAADYLNRSSAAAQTMKPSPGIRTMPKRNPNVVSWGTQ